MAKVDAIVAAKASMLADMARLDRIGQNLTNLSTPGYRRELVVAVPFLTAMGHAGTTVASIDRQSLNQQIQVVRDMRGGALNRTGSAFDVALDAGVYLEVAGATGTLYSKGGSLRRDALGRLVTNQGLPLVGDGGDLRLTRDDFSIGRDGRVTEANQSIGQLRLVRIDQEQTLQYAGNGLYQASAATMVQPANDGLKQGYVELSNVSHAGEMVRLIETTRHFESSQRVVMGYMSMVDTAMDVLGSF
jgi:flagellar basal-body rod protein FlgF